MYSTSQVSNQTDVTLQGVWVFDTNDISSYVEVSNFIDRLKVLFVS
jgi:hypothetical protein